MLVIFYYSLCQAVVEPADGVDMVYLRSVICDGGKKGGRVKIWKRNHSIIQSPIASIHYPSTTTAKPSISCLPIRSRATAPSTRFVPSKQHPLLLRLMPSFHRSFSRTANFNLHINFQKCSSLTLLHPPTVQITPTILRKRRKQKLTE